MFTSRQLFERRRARNRAAIKRLSSGQPRLSVHRSSKHIYAQVIDDNAGDFIESEPGSGGFYGIKIQIQGFERNFQKTGELSGDSPVSQMIRTIGGHLQLKNMVISMLLNALTVEATHRQQVGQFLNLEIEIHVIAEPVDRYLHLSPLVNNGQSSRQENCLRNLTSFSVK